MIITVSRRTDILFFYSQWFINRINEGYCIVPNPFYPSQLSLISLLPKDVTAFSFWSRYPMPLFKHLPMLDDKGYNYYFEISINNYPKLYETNNPDVNKSIDCFIKFSEQIGRDKMFWRYDPVFFTDEIDLDFHIKNFDFIINQLAGYTNKLIISILDSYKKTIKRFHSAGINYDLNQLEHPSLNPFLIHIKNRCVENNIDVQFCAEEKDFSYLGIKKGKCVDDDYIRNTFNINFTAKKDKGQRSNCSCVESRDIGINNTCLSGCEYCYATSNHNTALMNRKKHDPQFPALLKIPFNNDIVNRIRIFKTENAFQPNLFLK